MKKVILVAVLAVLVWGGYEFYRSLVALAGLPTALVAKTEPQRGFLARTLRRDASLAGVGVSRPAVLPGPRAGRLDGAGALSTDSSGGVFASLGAALATPKEAAEAYLSEHRAAWGIQEYHTLKSQEYESPLGTRVKYSVYQDGIPVTGLSIELDVNRDHQVSTVENGYRPVKRIDTSAAYLTWEEVVQKNASRYFLDDKSTAGVSKIIYIAPGADEGEMAYVIPVTEISGNSPASTIIFRAADGQPIGRQASRAEF